MGQVLESFGHPSIRLVVSSLDEYLLMGVRHCLPALSSGIVSGDCPALPCLFRPGLACHDLPSIRISRIADAGCPAVPGVRSLSSR